MDPIPLAIRRWEGPTLLGVTVLGLLAFVVVYPILLLLLNSFLVSAPGAPPAYSLQGWKTALSEPGMLAAIKNTLSLTLARQAIAFPLGVLLAWLLARTDLPGRHFFEFLFWVSFFLPSLAVIMGWILLLEPGYGLLNLVLTRLGFFKEGPFDIYSWWGIVWIHLMTYNVSAVVMLLTPAFRNMDATLEEASRACGATTFGTFTRILVPLMAPAILAVLLLAFIRSLESFEIELILGAPVRIDVYSTKVYRLLRQEPPLFAPATALGVIILVLMLPFIAVQRWIVSARSHVTLTGQFKPRLLELRKSRWPAFALVSLFVLLLTAVPLVLLLAGTFTRLYGYFHVANPWTVKHWRSVLTDRYFLDALRNTLVIASGSAFLGVFIYSLVAYLIGRTAIKARAALDFISWLPFTLPGIILGLGFLWLFLGTAVFRPLYGGMLVLVLANVILSMPLGVQILKSGMLQLGRDLEEAGRTSGGSWWQTFSRIVLPILSPSLLTAWVMSFVLAARTTSHIALLTNNANQPLAWLQLKYMMDQRYEEAGVIGILIVLLTVGVALVTRLFGLRRTRIIHAV